MTIIYILALLVCFFLLINFIGLAFFPRLTRIQQSITINRPASEIFPKVVSLRSFVTWDPWSGRDPNIQQSFEGEEGQIGAIYRWKGNKEVKEGSMKTVQIIPNELVEHELTFGKGNKNRALIKLIPEGESTQVIWGVELNMGIMPFTRIVGSLLKGMLERDFSQGLNKLKEEVNG